MKLVKDMGTKVQVEFNQSEWAAIVDALIVRCDALKEHPDQETAREWWEPLEEFIDIIPNDFLIREGNTALSITK